MRAIRAMRVSSEVFESISHAGARTHVVLGPIRPVRVAGNGSTGMKSVPHMTTAARFALAADERSHHSPRLRLKPKAPATGYVDGAWWPTSRDLTAELPSLLAVLAVRLEGIERVTFNLSAWPPTGRRLAFGGGDVRLEDFRAQHSGTVTVIGAWDRHRVTLLVVPPETDPDLAQRMLMTAAHRGNKDSVETLLAGSGTSAEQDRAAAGD